MSMMKRRTFVASLAATAAYLAGGAGRFVRAASAPVFLKFTEVWVAGMKFSERTRQLDKKRVVMRGFMAPPLKPDAKFFVLTRIPMAVCPFCESEAEWPDDIVFVRLKKHQEFTFYNIPIETTGILEIGTDIDKESGFVSRLRIVDAKFKEKLG